MVPPGKVQIPGFTDKDTHKEVIMKGAKGLGIDSPVHQLSLLISNCLVKDVSLPSGKSWTLGNYTAEFGGPQARGKRTFGIFVPFTKRDEGNDIDDDYEVCGFTYWPCQICACMHGCIYRFKPVLVICWKIKYMMTMTWRSVLIFLLCT